MTATSAAKELLNDLLTLEIDVIVKPGMTARKMPDLPHALIDIVDTYDPWLCQKAGELDPLWARFLGTPQAATLVARRPKDSKLFDDKGVLIPALSFAPLSVGKPTVNTDLFRELRLRAKRAEEMYLELVASGLLRDDGTNLIFKRIYRNCDQIKGILEGRRLDDRTEKEREALVATADEGFSRETAAKVDLPLTADEVLVVRKAWEVGVEDVLMQTVVQLDGDVITRVKQARLAAGEGPLYELHKQAVATAMTQWQFLVKTLAQITTKFASFLPF